MIQSKNAMQLLVLFYIMSVLVACKPDRWRVDTNNINVDISIKRLELEMFGPESSQVIEDVERLTKEFGEFFRLYNMEMINLGNPRDGNYPVYLEHFINDSIMQMVYTHTVWKFPDLDTVENRLTLAFRRFYHHFPAQEIPQVYSCISGFNQSVVTSKGVLGISLDKYLGQDCDFYAKLGTEMYKRRKMIPQKIAPDAVQAWLMAIYEYKTTPDNLLNQMVYFGKIMYVLDALLPQHSDTIKWGFTQQQWEWANKYEAETWNFLVENSKLFSSDLDDIRKFINEAPFTAPFTNKSAPRMGVFTGYKIVEAYMEKHPQMTLEQLMDETDGQSILQKSRYKP